MINKWSSGFKKPSKQRHEILRNHHQRTRQPRRQKGGNEFLQVELSAFGKIVGYVVLEITEDARGEPVQYCLKFAPHRDAMDWVMLKLGHKSEGVIETIQA